MGEQKSIHRRIRRVDWIVMVIAESRQTLFSSFPLGLSFDILRIRSIDVIIGEGTRERKRKQLFSFNRTAPTTGTSGNRFQSRTVQRGGFVSGVP